MRKTLLIFLAGVLVLSAAEWDIEQITDETDLWSTDPILVLDAQWHPHILFTQWNEEVHIKVASHDTDLWIIDDVATASEYFMPYYSIDVDSEGNTFVAYFDWAGMANVDIFVASDEEGEFTSVNVTDDEAFQVAPVMKLDQNGVPRMLYAEANAADDTMRLFYGWVDEEGLHGELVAENMYQDEYLGYDLVYEQGPIIIPHVFYIGDDDHLWHTTSGEPAWIAEPLNDLSSEWPSAVADPLGSFHVAYDVGGLSIHYITDMSGTWQDELVSDLGVPEGGNERPSLALETVYGGYLGIGNPHVVWMHADADADWWYDLYYSGKTTGAWSSEEPVTVTPEKDELPGYGRYFALDVEGYGHLVFCAEDENYVTQIFYAKSTEPLTGSAIAEQPMTGNPFELEIRGSSIYFSLQETSCIRLDLYDAAGRLLEQLASGKYPAGEHSIPINSTGLPAGVYFVMGQIGGRTANVKFVLTR